jgi:hypothetical protein
MSLDLATARQKYVIPNRTKAKMLRGEIAWIYHTYLIPRHEMAGFTAQAGFDGLLIDLEHGTIGLDQAANLAAICMNLG